MTVESFLQWKAKFDAELEALKTIKQKQLEAAMKGRMTGKQLFLQKKAVDEIESEALVANQVQGTGVEMIFLIFQFSKEIFKTLFKSRRVPV